MFVQPDECFGSRCVQTSCTAVDWFDYNRQVLPLT